MDMNGFMNKRVTVNGMNKNMDWWSCVLLKVLDIGIANDTKMAKNKIS